MRLLKLMEKITFFVFTFLLYEKMVFAIPEPAYLRVPEFQSCLVLENKGSWTAYCLPSSRPKACPIDSWQRLSHDHSLNRCT